MKNFVGLLRGINVSGQNKIPMADLRLLCLELGWSHIQTYIQSGNLLFSTKQNSASAETELEQAIEQRFELHIPVIVRSAVDWLRYLQSNPFPEACKTEANLVMLALSKAPPKVDAIQELRKKAIGGEVIEQAEDAIWIHYKTGIGKSKITPVILDRLIGSPVTTRNWNTATKLGNLTLENNDAQNA